MPKLDSYLCVLLLTTLTPLACTDNGDHDYDDMGGPDDLDLDASDVLQGPREPAAAPAAVQVETTCGGKTGVYCVTVHLKDGAKLKPFMASKPLAVGGTNECRGWSNTFSELTVKQFTALDLAYDGYNLKNAQVVISGSYSNDKGKPAFPQKVSSSGWISTFGYECTALGGANDMWILQIRNAQGRAFIEPFNLAKFKDPSSAPEAIVGFNPWFDKGDANYLKGRNFVGLINPYNGGYGTVVFVISASNPGITASTAINILKNKGALESQILHLDDSTVAQLSDRTSGSWQHRVSDTRNMPQAFGVFAP